MIDSFPSLEHFSYTKYTYKVQNKFIRYENRPPLPNKFLKALYVIEKEHTTFIVL